MSDDHDNTRALVQASEQAGVQPEHACSDFDYHRAGIFLCPSSLAEADAPLVDLEAFEVSR